MKRITSVLLVLSVFFSCAGINTTGGSGTFRGKWYSYYQRGLGYSDNSSWNNAVRDFQRAISKRPRDQRDARTYGMHLIPYFPHRELGIAYLNRSEIEKAIEELETSIAHEETAKAIFYLNKARKISLEQQGRRIAPPAIEIYSPEESEALNSFTARVTGRVTGEGYVAKITVNGVPFRFELAQRDIAFAVDIALDGGTQKIAVMAEDLLGSPSARSVIISIDREGPAISIYDIAEDGSSVSVTGAVNDSTGINRLLVNGESLSVKDPGTYLFNMRINRASIPSPFVIEAYDTLNNRTRAEIDIKKELQAFRSQGEPVLLALSASDLFSTDSAPPVISLKDSAGMPPVFVETYYVEGEVSDNRKVENIYVNESTVLTGRGKKVFFSKLVRLNEGENDISVEALDSSGNRSEAGFAVMRKIPQVLQIGSRMSISVLPFSENEKVTPVELLAYDQLTGSFVEQRRFNVMEREKLEEILLEHKLTKDKLTDPEYSIKVGKLMASDTVLATSVIAGASSVEFTSKVINTETSEIMDVKDVYSENTSSASIRELMEGLASKVAGSFPLVEGMVIKGDKKYIYTDLGTNTGIRRETEIILYRPGAEIRHPLTGKYLGRDMLNLGAADIEEIYEEFSKAKFNEKKSANTIRVHDMVITR